MTLVYFRKNVLKPISKRLKEKVIFIFSMIDCVQLHADILFHFSFHIQKQFLIFFYQLFCISVISIEVHAQPKVSQNIHLVSFELV